jgi:hypothetical protein
MTRERNVPSEYLEEGIVVLLSSCDGVRRGGGVGAMLRATDVMTSAVISTAFAAILLDEYLFRIAR